MCWWGCAMFCQRRPCTHEKLRPHRCARGYRAGTTAGVRSSTFSVRRAGPFGYGGQQSGIIFCQLRWPFTHLPQADSIIGHQDRRGVMYRYRSGPRQLCLENMRGQCRTGVFLFGSAPVRRCGPEKGKSPRELIPPTAIYRAGPATPYVKFLTD